MSFNLGISQEDLAKTPSSGSSFITSSGIYNVTILAVTMDVNENEAVTFGFYVDLGNDNKQMLYGALPMSSYDNKLVYEGNRKVFGSLCAIADVPATTNFQPVEASLPIGKAGAEKDVHILEQFEDVEVKMWIKCEYYRKKDGTIGENRLVHEFYRASDNAAREEILNNENIGTRYAKQEKYFTDSKYGTAKDPVSEEEVAAMIEARKSGTTPPAAATPAKTAPRSKFAK